MFDLIYCNIQGDYVVPSHCDEYHFLQLYSDSDLVITYALHLYATNELFITYLVWTLFNKMVVLSVNIYILNMHKESCFLNPINIVSYYSPHLPHFNVTDLCYSVHVLVQCIDAQHINHCVAALQVLRTLKVVPTKLFS